MAKNQKPKRDEGVPTKVVAIPRHSTPRTAENKARRAATLARRFAAAAARRTKRSYTDPETGKTSFQGKKHYRATIGREIQTERIEKKRDQRVKFRKLTPELKREHREAGSQYRIPADLLKSR